MPTRPRVHRPAGWRSPEEREQARKAMVDRQRGSASARGYDRDWTRVRNAVLASEPLCRQCAAQGKVTPATEVDHIIPVRERPDLQLDRSNLQPLCHACHSAKTTRENGGFGNAHPTASSRR